ncbi:MAG: TonB-dependent receptor [Bacteroidetes bacterium]|nr:MAG: TonB-dependent receptor [Bacteroidota bacterium]
MKYIISMSFILVFIYGFGQLKGVVYGNMEKEREVLIGAKIKSLKYKRGAVTNEEGTFELVLGKDFPDTLIISAFGYLNDTLVVTKKDRFAIIEINLYSDQLLPEVIVEARKNHHGILKLKTLQVEHVGEGELRKAACCNLSESFETNASVDVNVTDGVSGAKKIQMMGLDGVYTQIQMENIPYLRGLESAFGMSAIPGTWIESIQITKGTGNVVNGYESMAGLINLEVKKPENIERLYLNAYGNRFGRAELNLHGGGRVGKKWYGAAFGHVAGMFGEVDENKDGFRDIPQSRNLSFLNRWKYNGKRMEAQIGVNTYYEEKEGGQNGFRSGVNSNLYGVYVENKHADVFAKTGFPFQKKPYQSIGVIYQAKYHETAATFGNRVFSGQESRAYVNAIYDGIIGNTNHKIKTGLSFVYSDLTQQLDSIRIPREEIVPGAFAEYTYEGLRFTSIAGVRMDYHNLYGIQLSPRVHGKYLLNEHLTFRFSGGKGFRVANAIIDNISLLASSRNWVLENIQQPEISWNVGGSLVQEFKLFGRESSLSMDYYHTAFENQLVVDRDQRVDEIHFKTLENASFSNSFQTELGLELLPRFDMRLAFKYLDVRSRFGGELQQQLMIPKYRSLLNLGYKTRNRRWEFDLTASYFGKKRLPVYVMDATGTLSEKNESEAFVLLNAQITHVFHDWEFYLGGENLTNYRQKDPIIASNNPFGPNFDATRIWAPVQGTNVYFGIRYKIKKQKEEK